MGIAVPGAPAPEMQVVAGEGGGRRRQVVAGRGGEGAECRCQDTHSYSYDDGAKGGGGRVRQDQGIRVESCGGERRCQGEATGTLLNDIVRTWTESVLADMKESLDGSQGSIPGGVGIRAAFRLSSLQQKKWGAGWACAQRGQHGR